MTRHLSKKRANLKGKKHSKKQKGGKPHTNLDDYEILNDSNIAKTIYTAATATGSYKERNESLYNDPQTLIDRKAMKKQEMSIDSFNREPNGYILLKTHDNISGDRDRYLDIPSYNFNRVLLNDNDGPEGYINASYIPRFPYIITASKSRKDYNQQNTQIKYIASQGPIGCKPCRPIEILDANGKPIYESPESNKIGQFGAKYTIDHFYQMIWENDIKVVVMLTNIVEKGRVKCGQYWPDLNKGSVPADENEKYMVTNEGKTSNNGYVIRKLKIEFNGQVKHFLQLHYTKWPDLGVPKDEDIISLIEFTMLCRLLTETKKINKMIVHCSAGVGRTGFFIILDMLFSINKMKDHTLLDSETSITKLIKLLRNFRFLAVQAEEQYTLLIKLRLYLYTQKGQDDIKSLVPKVTKIRDELDQYFDREEIEIGINRNQSGEEAANNTINLLKAAIGNKYIVTEPTKEQKLREKIEAVAKKKEERKAKKEKTERKRSEKKRNITEKKSKKKKKKEKKKKSKKKCKKGKHGEQCRREEIDRLKRIVEIGSEHTVSISQARAASNAQETLINKYDITWP